MPNVVEALKSEMSRIGRKESKAAVTPMQARLVKSDKAAAELKRRVAGLEQVVKQLQTRLAKIEPDQPATPVVTAAPTSREWISGKGIKSLRKKLGVSQAQFAKLAGVSDQAVYMWERKPGVLKLRTNTKAAVMAVRELSKGEAKQRLAGLG